MLHRLCVVPIIAQVIVVSGATGCTYLYNVAKQSSYTRAHHANPSQRNLKHMIERQTYFVYGRVLDPEVLFSGLPFAVAAYCDKYKTGELVDSAQVARAGTHFGLNLPEGQYEVLVFVDKNENAVFDQSELVGQSLVVLDADKYPDKIVDSLDIVAETQRLANREVSLPAVRSVSRSTESLVFPKGAIRQLNDPLFDRDIASLGVYEPAAFLEMASTMFYALEEDSYKLPVVFVHGIGGSAREFAPIIDRLDRTLYQPWFFYYASGTDLNQLASLFYDIYLSGTVVNKGVVPITIVAHSMGGLVVREALNQYAGAERENRLDLLITIATPFDGHPAAAKGVERAPLVIPSWRDLDPNSTFIKHLFRRPLAANVNHQLLFAEGTLAGQLHEGRGDGVVPLKSQLRSTAQAEASTQTGFAASHTGVLRDDAAIRYVLHAISQVENVYPEEHLKVLALGGYTEELTDRYSPMEKHLILSMGKYLAALANGTLGTLGSAELQRFVKVAQGQAEAKSDAETAWRKFISDYPNYARPQSLR